MAIELTGEQEAVAERAIEFVRRGGMPDGRRYFVFEGLAGVGKTQVLSELARRLDNASMAALFGKAAANLTAKTGLPASTIHSLIYRLHGETIDERGRRELVFGTAISDNALRHRVILLDECGVVPTQVGEDLLRTGALVIAAGDPGQLPPVKGTRFFTSPYGPDACLETVHRQAWDSGIIRQAWRVRQTGQYGPDGPEMQVLREVTPQMVQRAGIILCWKNVTRRKLITLKRQHLWLPPDRLLKGEPVMCLLNVHERGIMNGQVCDLAADYEPDQMMYVTRGDGEIVEFDPEQCWMEGFEGDEWQSDDILRGVKGKGVVPFCPAWAATVHKFIGSETDDVIFYDEYSLPDFRREFVYTGLTRAAKNCAVVR